MSRERSSSDIRRYRCAGGNPGAGDCGGDALIWWTMTVLHWTCTTVGAGVLTFVAWSFLSEVIRAFRQSHRVATVVVRVIGHERRRPTWREWWFRFRREFFQSYSYRTIGFVQIPHNPSERMRGAYHG